jgi:hypothetical protein
LRTGVGHVKVVEGDVLDELFALVDLAFGKGDVGFGFEVIFRSVGVGAADSLTEGGRRGSASSSEGGGGRVQVDFERSSSNIDSQQLSIADDQREEAAPANVP